jgi:hypothetical protein
MGKDIAARYSAWQMTAAYLYQSLPRFARKTRKSPVRRFLPYKPHTEPVNRGSFGTKRRENPQVQQAARGEACPK